MKRILSIICACIILCSLTACNKKKVIEKSTEFNFEVTEEAFEKLEIFNPTSSGQTTIYALESMIEQADVIIVGMPKDTFTSCEVRYLDHEGHDVPAGNSIDHVATLRNIQVLETIKGEGLITNGKLIKADEAYAAMNDDGTGYIVGLDEAQYIPKKNCKYIFFLKAIGDSNIYTPIGRNATVNIDGLHEGADKYITENALNAIKEEYADYYTKYDRSDELVGGEEAK